MSTSESKAAFESMKATLKDPSHWTKGHFAGDAQNDMVLVMDESAVCFCLAGALLKHESILNLNDRCPKAWRIMRNAAVMRGYLTIPDFNDDPETTHQDVLNFLDECIAEASK